MSPKWRMDAPTTIDAVHHQLHLAQVEGWGLSEIKDHIEYKRVHGKGPKLPVGRTITIRLEPR